MTVEKNPQTRTTLFHLRRLPLCTKCLTSQRVSEEEREVRNSVVRARNESGRNRLRRREGEEGNFLPSASKGFR